MKKFAIVLILLLGACAIPNQQPIKIGWISDLSGPVAKYGAYEAGMLAVEEINQKGGINGRPIQLIAEDGKCNPKAATDAINKLIQVDNVKIVLGGHCTPESMNIAPIAEENKIIQLASITSSPKFSGIGEYIFRTSPVSIAQSALIADYAINNGIKKIAIIYEQTDYALPIAEKLKTEFTSKGGEVTNFEAYAPATEDFRTILLKVKSQNPEAIFISPQSPDAALLLIKQIKEIGLNARLFGNDVAINQAIIDKFPDKYEGFIGATPDFDTENPKTKTFIEAYKKKYNVQNIPYGIWTAETYDAVYIIADAISKNGEDVEKIKEYLSNIKDYQGASGTFSINEKHDGVRTYTLKTVKNGKLENYKP